MQIKNAVALVTGANRGIGRQIVEALLKAGVSRVYAGARNLDSLSEVTALDPKRVVGLELDITKPDQLAAAAAQATDLTLLINNAGALAGNNALAGSLDEIKRDMDVNYYGTLNAIRAFTPTLEKNGRGAITNVLSVVSWVSAVGIAGYSASKAAAYSMTLAVRPLLAEKNIDLYGVYPGPVDTEMLDGVEMDKATPASVAQEIIAGIEAGSEIILPDAMSKQAYQGWRQDHQAFERQFATML